MGNIAEGPESHRKTIQKNLPAAPIRRLTRPIVRFLHVESASGIVLMICTAVALFLANSAWSQEFAHLWETHIGLTIGTWELNKPLEWWINDVLMVLFFFVVGLEIKRELVVGELRDPKKAALPVMAALGGMLIPAGIYYLLQQGQPGERGWGIPMATDIAFVVGVMALLGPRVPFGLKILLLSLAIADDIGAVLVIGVFYSSDLNTNMLLYAGVGFGLTYSLNRLGVRQVPIYFLVGAGIWYCVLQSGVHPTIAGVLLGLMTPSSAWVGDKALMDILADSLNRLQGTSSEEGGARRQLAMDQLTFTTNEAVSPLERLQTALHPWVAFLIMPVFALANAGVVIAPEAISHPVATAVAAGLVFGKPIGIFLFSWLAVKIGLARLPSGVNWKILFGAGCLAGIGFTMSLFVAHLALKDELLEAGKIGTLIGSAGSTILGCVILLIFLSKKPTN